MTMSQRSVGAINSILEWIFRGKSNTKLRNRNKYQVDVARNF